MKFSWQNLIGILLIVVGTVIGLSVKVPVVVIGGINCDTTPKLNKLNIAGYAMIRPIIKQSNIIEETKKIRMIVNKNIKSPNIDIKDS